MARTGISQVCDRPSPGRRGVHRIRCLLLVLASLLFTSSRGLAQVSPAASTPDAVPRGYQMQTDGAVHWTFPRAAQSEVQALRRSLRELWPAFGTQLGAYLEPALDIRVAVNPEDMQRMAPHGRTLPAYATGVAFPADGIILLAMTAPDSWVRPDMERLLIHELSHVALHRAVKGHDVPRWFTEGLAIVHSGEHSLARVRTLWAATLQGELLPLRLLASSFGVHHGEVDLAYAQSADLVGFLLEGERSNAQLHALTTRVAAGEAFGEAFAAAYGLPLSEFEHNWRLQLAQRFGRWPSILSGLSAVWGIAALLLVAGYVRVRRRQRRTLQRWAIEEAPSLPAAEAQLGVQPPPLPSPRNPADVVLDAWVDQQRHEAGIPTIVHEGRSYTLH